MIGKLKLNENRRSGDTKGHATKGKVAREIFAEVIRCIGITRSSINFPITLHYERILVTIKTADVRMIETTSERSDQTSANSIIFIRDTRDQPTLNFYVDSNFKNIIKHIEREVTSLNFFSRIQFNYLTSIYVVV